MITSFAEIENKINNKPAISLAVVQPNQPDVMAALETAENRGWIRTHIFQDSDPVQAARQAVAAIRSGAASLLMKGNIDTATLLKAVLDKSTGIATGRRLSHVAVVESPAYSRLMFWTDGGVNIHLDESNIDSIIANALLVTRACEVAKPRIALLALVEKVTAALPETQFAGRIAAEYGSRDDFTIEGPVALDVALAEEAARHKGIASKIAGKTDIFIGPFITTTNHVVKALLSLGGATGGGIILGAQVPVVLLSRSDTKDIKLNSIALGVLLAEGD